MCFPHMNTATHVTRKQTTTTNILWKKIQPRHDRLQGKEHPPSTLTGGGPGGGWFMGCGNGQGYSTQMLHVWNIHLLFTINIPYMERLEYIPFPELTACSWKWMDWKTIVSGWKMPIFRGKLLVSGRVGISESRKSELEQCLSNSW